MSTIGSVEEIVNLALDRIGFPEYVGNIYDGTRQARAALNCYAETRDALLRSKDWAFAFRQALAVAAGVALPTGWLFVWTYPADCLRVRALQPTAVYPELDPQPVLFELAVVAGVKVILSQLTPVTINYIGQITNVTLWDAGFVEAMVQALAAKLAAALRDGPIDIGPDRGIETAIGADEPQAPNDAAAAAVVPAAPARRAS